MVEYFKIGKFVTAHGVQGELVLKHELGKNFSEGVTYRFC